MTAPVHGATNVDYRARAADLFPGGVNSPVRAYWAVGGEPPVIVRGEGSRVWDADGNRFIDLVGAFGPLILGHADPTVVETLRRQLDLGGPYGATSPGEVELGEAIRAAMPSMQRLRFVSSGTEAAMSALRVARAATGRDLIVKFAGGYHGHADGLLAEAGSGLATLSLPASAGVTQEVAAQTLVVPYNDLTAVRELFVRQAGRIAAVIVEPVAANMGVVPPAPGFLEGLREITAGGGAILIFDEVITGFRVAPGGAQALYGIEPDLTVLGKIIGGGLPVGAYGGRRELMALVAPDGPVYQAGTLSGHPLAMAAGMATLQSLSSDSYDALEELGASLQGGLERAAALASVPISVTRVGSLLTPFFRQSVPRNYEEARQADGAAYANFFRGMRGAGILLPPSPHEAWFLSLAHSQSNINEAIAAAAEAFRA
jgi:glutamate-1-semialdehyde 2,1-aminomutase